MRTRTKLLTSVCAVSALVLLTIYAFGQSMLEDECSSSFSGSSASNSCGELISCNLGQFEYPCVDTSQVNVSTNGNQCVISVYCARNNHMTDAPTQNTFQGSPTDVNALNNCDGSLQLASC